jgi:hypothetical protein
VQGAQGFDGAQGDVGTTGVQGTFGAQGPQGNTNAPTGLQGATYGPTLSFDSAVPASVSTAYGAFRVTGPTEASVSEAIVMAACTIVLTVNAAVGPSASGSATLSLPVPSLPPGESGLAGVGGITFGGGSPSVPVVLGVIPLSTTTLSLAYANLAASVGDTMTVSVVFSYAAPS